MIKQLIYKELKLVINPFTYSFLLLAGLLLIPDYPYFVAMFYFFMALQINFNMMKESRDMEFSAMLPVTRRDIVLSKFFDVVFIQLLQVIAAAPFALISSLVLYPGGNIVGMDANIAFFGYVFIAFAVFNIIFLPAFFKTGNKIGVPMITAMLGMVAVYACLEVITAFVPALHNNIDGLDSGAVGWRVLVLAAGIAVYIVTLLWAYKKSIKRFDKVSL